MTKPNFILSFERQTICEKMVCFQVFFLTRNRLNLNFPLKKCWRGCFVLRILFLIMIFSSLLEGKEKICLNMIVKNESQVIKRCLDSVKPIIDYWVIVDTGSTDGTQELIKDYMKDIPGELVERPWKNFGFNRTEALELAKGKADFILIIDADDWLEFDADFVWPELTADAYEMWRGSRDFSYLIPQIIRSQLPWKWKGVLHEYLDCGQNFTSKILEKMRYVSGCDGASSHDVEKFKKYIAMLEEGLKEEPNNERYVFYLGEACRDAGEKLKAIEWYQKRVAIGGWDEEVFWSKLQIALLAKELNFQKDFVIWQFYLCHAFRPHRSEPVYYLAELFNGEKNHLMAYELIKGKKSHVRKEKDLLFNMNWIDEYGLDIQLFLAAYYLGFYQESLEVCNQLLANKSLPLEWRKYVEDNRSFALEKIMENRPKL